MMLQSGARYTLQETELKLEIDPDDLALVLESPVLSKARPSSKRQITIYYDTPETRLKEKGFTLRVRSVGDKFIQTVKPMIASAGLVSRDEFECEVRSIKPDLELLAGHPIHAVVAKCSERLEAVIVSDVKRTTWLIECHDALIEVDLDRGTISSGEHGHEFCELEFELVRGTPLALIIAARRLADYAPVRLGVLSKAERGFLIAEGTLGKLTKAAPVGVTRENDVRQAFETIVHACLRHYRLNEPLVLKKRMPSALHQARVAMRRLRSAFTLFRPVINDVEYQYLRSELREFTSRLGGARNLDVYLERTLDEETRTRLTSAREEAYDAVAQAMNSDRFRRLLIDIVGWTAVGSWREGKAARRAIEPFASRRLDRIWTSIASTGRNLAKLDDEGRHKLRIKGKKLRYALEFLDGVYPRAHDREKRFSNAIEQLQDSLGKLNDLTVARTIQDAAPVEPAWLIGSLDERKHLMDAEGAMRALLSAGPFWSSTPTMQDCS